MHRNACSFCFLALILAGFGGCSSQQPAQETKKGPAKLDKIQGKAQVVLSEATAADAAMNQGGPSVYLWEGARRYRLFFNKPFTVDPGKEYVAEGVDAQEEIEKIGDPDQGKNGYPLASSCQRVVKMAWSGLPFDVSDGQASVLRARVKRYPARPVFLVTKIQPVESKAKAAEEEKEVPEVSVPGDKQRAFLIEGPVVQTAPLWEPAGGTVKCKVVIEPDGKIDELETGTQLCEIVPWARFRYQPPVQRGHPVKVKTEVEVRFEPRK